MNQQRGARHLGNAAVAGSRVARGRGVLALAVSSVLLSAFTMVGARASAQTSATQASAPQAEPSASDRTAAGEAYDRGTAAYLAREYGRAAQLFETAYRLAPNSAALIQAIRAHDRAGDHLRAATLALRLQAHHGDDRQATRQADTTLRAAGRQFLRVDVTCDAACTVELDGTLEDHTSFFVDPGSPHTVRASFDTGTPDSQTTTGDAGDTLALTFARPPAPPPPPEPEPVVAVTPPPDSTPIAPPPPPASGGGLSPAAFITLACLTAASAGVLVWSGVDTLAGVPAYRADPTTARLQDGQGRELRTNVMIGITSALGVTAVLLAIFTDWDGDPSSADAPPVSAFLSPEGAFLSTWGRL